MPLLTEAGDLLTLETGAILALETDEAPTVEEPMDEEPKPRRKRVAIFTRRRG